MGISWSSVEIVGPDLPRQLSWIRKQPCQNILQVRVAQTWPTVTVTAGTAFKALGWKFLACQSRHRSAHPIRQLPSRP